MMQEIVTERLLLTKLSSENAGEVLELLARNCAYLEPWEPARKDDYYTLSHQGEILATVAREESEGRQCVWWLRLRASGELIGRVNFSSIVRGAFQSCFLGYFMAESHCNQGYMTEALTAAVYYIFAKEALHRVEANVMPRNKASLRVLEKLGFEPEGLARCYLKINGVWEDHLHMVRLNE